MSGARHHLKEETMYEQSITRSRRTAFVILIDGSGSMSEELLSQGRRTTKAEAVAAITNNLLFELIERARRNDGVRDYYDIAVLSYGGDDRVESLFAAGREWLPVSELAASGVPVGTATVEFRLPDGRSSLREIPAPQWIAPRAAGQTPMYEALLTARDLVSGWVVRPENADSFPPVVFNITDGEATDGDDEDLLTVCNQIKQLGTTDGRVLLINIHLATGDAARPVLFPSADEARYPSRYASLLYACSSEMPALFDPAIRAAKGPGALPPFRGMSYNASTAELISILNIGSISLKTE